ncbi:MAG: hypothetical protein IKA83_04095 [Paludibacteraceae bacterium]|nr:hypothetical protein [Paludibacteraceae bacterium]
MKKKLFKNLLLFASMLAILTSCEGKEPETNTKEVEIVEVTNIGVESATFKGIINKELSDYDDYEFGVLVKKDAIYSGGLEELIERDFILDYLYKADVLINGRFTVNVEGLEAGEAYHYCAYLIVNKDLYIFETDDQYEFKTFYTIDSSQSNANGHNYVDLGLPSGVKWATCNLGAERPEDVGNYYAWGDTYWSANYFGIEVYDFIKNGSVDFTGINKYTIPDNNLDGIWYDKEGNFIGDNKRVLSYEDDAARYQWGGDWRMPRYEDFYELIDEENSTVANVTYNGVKGLQVTSKKNGNSIFLPFTGVYTETDIVAKDIMGKYWTNSLSGETQNARAWNFFEDGRRYDDSTLRYYGACIRPVLP